MASEATPQLRISPLAIPNLLTYGRMLAIPALVFVYFFDGLWVRWVMLAIFTFACVSDFFDGYLARAWGQQSALGRMLDPIADKLLVAACLVLLVALGTIGYWSMIAAVIILSREILVSGLREFLAEINVSVPVTRLAKWKTTAQMFALGFLLAGPAGEQVLPYCTLIGLWLLWISAIITLYTGWDYLQAGIRHIVEHDQ